MTRVAFDCRIDALFAAVSIYFFATTLSAEDCYSPECPQQIKTWLLGSFFSLFALQGLVVTIFASKDRRVSLLIFIMTTLVYAPAMLMFNIWGNALVEQVESNTMCKFEGVAQSFELLYLLSIYCSLFIYFIYTAVVRECFKRFFLAMDMNPTILYSSFNPHGF